MQLLIKYGNIALTTTTIPQTRYPSSLLLLVRLGGYIANLFDFYSYRLIGKLTVFFQLQEFSLCNLIVVSSEILPLPPDGFSSVLKSRVSNILVKTEALRINLNLDGTPIASKSHTHPSHSQTSCLLTSSLSLGVGYPLNEETDIRPEMGRMKQEQEKTWSTPTSRTIYQWSEVSKTKSDVNTSKQTVWTQVVRNRM
jgi:hypothetical protein